MGSHAADLHLTALFHLQDGAIFTRPAASINAPRWTVAWQRLIRVLSHEINNRSRVPRPQPLSPGLPTPASASPACLPPRNPQGSHRHIAQLETRLPVRIHPGPDVFFECDPDQIQQAHINLIQNATDAVLCPGLLRDPYVELGWTKSSGEIVIRLDDIGVGVGNFANLFVPFYTTKPNGSGIGLAQQTAQAHGGGITLKPRQNGPGTRVEMRLLYKRPLP